MPFQRSCVASTMSNHSSLAFEESSGKR
jgi:hypothetical protein